MKKYFIVRISNEKLMDLKQFIAEEYTSDVVLFDDEHIIITGEDIVTNQAENTIRMMMNQFDAQSELIEETNTPTYRKILFLQGLDCANCAAKIERVARRHLDHESLTVDFATSRLIIESKSETLRKTLIKDVQVIASSVDPAIKVTEKTQTNQEKVVFVRFTKWELSSLILGMLFFVGGIIMKNVLPMFSISISPFFIVSSFIIAYALLGWDVLYGALKNIGSGRFFDEKFLMSLATIVAISIRYYEEAVSVMLFYKMGELAQNYAVNKSRRSIASLLDIKPTHANLIVHGEVLEVNPLEIVANDIILVKLGERIPCDGIIIEGEASLDVSALTGESKYLDVGVGDEVISGSISTNGAIKVKVEKIYEESMISQILNLVENASSLKSKSEKFISKFARFYTPIICALAILLALSPLVIKGISFRESIYSATIFLVVSCPCALVISVPLGFFGGIGGASHKGILIKGSNYLEILGNLKGIVFDKTGTLTQGTFKLVNLIPQNISQEELLEFAAYAEMGSNHPIAKSIVKEYGIDRLDHKRVKVIPSITKSGSQVILDDHEIAIGNIGFMDKMKVKIPDIDSSGVILYVVCDLKYVGAVILKDQIRYEASKVVKTLEGMGLSISMFTGDKELEASEVAESIGIKKVYAGMMPVDKVKKLRQLKKNTERGYLAFVGDGINDAPALSIADVGIAMGGLGSDAAIKVADVVLMDDDLSRIPVAIQIAKKTKKIITQNIVLALVVKIIVLAAAIFADYIPILNDLTTYLMLEAIFADVGVSLIAILNSLRAANVK
ncbi:MAG: heavy metal translocating P-type ATPase [Bacilli bacterium]|nr:heavy metal translocating P-type ATPase [Bacilli bacterium]